MALAAFLLHECARLLLASSQPGTASLSSADPPAKAALSCWLFTKPGKLEKPKLHLSSGFGAALMGKGMPEGMGGSPWLREGEETLPV